MSLFIIPADATAMVELELYFIEQTEAALLAQLGTAGDFLAIDLYVVLGEWGAITGEITNEYILSSIFSRFYICK